MCCCSKSCIAKIGLSFTIIFGVLSIITIVLCGVDYDFVNFDWIEGEKYKSLPIVTLTSETIAIVVMVLGIIEFGCCANSKCFGIIVSMHLYNNIIIVPHYPNIISDFLFYHINYMFISK